MIRRFSRPSRSLHVPPAIRSRQPNARHSSSPTVNGRAVPSSSTPTPAKTSSTACSISAHDNGKEMTFPVDQVAVIDFVGGNRSRPSFCAAVERSAARDAERAN